MDAYRTDHGIAEQVFVMDGRINAIDDDVEFQASREVTKNDVLFAYSPAETWRMRITELASVIAEGGFGIGVVRHMEEAIRCYYLASNKTGA